MRQGEMQRPLWLVLWSDMYLLWLIKTLYYPIYKLLLFPSLFFIFSPPSCRELYIYTKLMTCHRQEVSGGCGRVRTWCCISDELEAREGEGVWKRWFVGVGVR